MLILKVLSVFVVLASFTACHKHSCDHHAKPATTTTGDNLVTTGTLQKQGFTTYQYGTHTLNGYVLESTTIDLDRYVGTNVTIHAVNTHYTVEQGPEMYNVTSIVAAP